MKKIFNKKRVIFLVLVLVAVGFVLFGQSVGAQSDDNSTTWAHWLVGGIARAIVSVLGWVLAQLMKILVYVAQYNHFINSAAISKGWIVARDISNMFFVVILLIIAFGTILNIESYNYKKWLPKLVLMAILINFSKTICGLLIDISQVVMLTFVNAFSDMAPGNLIEMLGVTDWQSLRGVEEVNNWEIAAAYVLAAIYAIIALVTITAIVGMLVMRIIMIWVYVVLSPFAYLLSAFPGGASYASQWWKEFTKNLIVGPVLAFFIWLSFAALGTPSDNGPQALGEFKDDGDQIECQRDENGVCKFGTSDLMVQFIVSIAMLIGGMKIAQEIGGAGGGIAGKAMGKVKGWGMAGAGAVGGFALAKAKMAGKGTLKGVKAVGGAGLSYGDKLAGNLVDQVTKQQNFGDKGLAGTLVLGAKNITSQKKAQLRTRLAGSSQDQALNEARRAHYEALKVNPNAVMDFNGKKYKSHQGRMVEADENGNLINNGQNVLRHKNKDVKAMSASSAAFYDAKRQNMRSINTETNKKETEKVEASKKNFESMNLTSDEIDRKLKSAATSAVDKMALAMIKASKGAFKDKGEVDEVKKYIGGNSTLTGQFNDALDAKRPDLNYDLSPGSADIATFKKRLGAGKIKTSELKGKALKNPDLLRALQDYSGKNFETTVNSMTKDASAEDFQNLSNTLKTLKNEHYAAGNTDKARETAKLSANISGNWGQAFQDDKGKIDLDVLKDFVRNASAKNLNQMSVKDYQEVIKDSNAKNVILENMTAGKLAQMMKEDSNAELVRAIRENIRNSLNTRVQQGAARQINNNAALLSY